GGRLASGEARDRLGAVVEDPPQVPTNEEAVGERADRPERNLVANPIADRGLALPVRLEEVRVLPERVRPLQLDIDEATRRLPDLDPGAPADRHAVQP